MEQHYKDIELRSEEVQEVMNRIPPAILRYGIGVLATVVVVLLVGSALFSYPETVQVEVTLMTESPPIYLKSPQTGRIEKLYVKNGLQVKKGDILAIMENLADTEDMLRLRQCLNDWQQNGAKIEELDVIFFPRIPMLGSVQNTYASCLMSWSNYLQNIGKSRVPEIELNTTVTQLMNMVEEWSKTNLLVSPVDGHVAFMQLWTDREYVRTDETMFVIITNKDSSYMGKAQLPAQGVGKVRLGQRAIIRLDGFSEQEFGRIEGKVISVSPVPDENGNYVLEVAIPEKELFLNNKNQLGINVISGKAEIIIKDCSILERLFNK